MTDKTISQLSAITTLAASDLLAVDQDIGGGSYTTTKITGANLFAGALAPASLAVNGATIGSDKLAVTGSATISGALVSSTSLTSGVQQTTQGALVLANTAAGAFATTVKSSNSASAAYTLTLPPNAGTNTYLLQTNGSGVTSWVAPPSSGVTSITGTANQITASASTGAVTLSLPSALQTTSLALNGATIGSDKLAVTGSATISGALVSNTSLTAGVQQTTQGALVLANTAAGAFATTVKSSNSASAAYTFTLPPNAGTNTYLLQTNGSGVTSWVAPPSSGVTSITGTANQITASASTGAVTLSLPSALQTSSLALNGATIGSDKLAVTGSVSISGIAVIDTVTVSTKLNASGLVNFGQTSATGSGSAGGWQFVFDSTNGSTLQSYGSKALRLNNQGNCVVVGNGTPTDVTLGLEVFGAAKFATSLAISGASIGSNKLAVAGSAELTGTIKNGASYTDGARITGLANNTWQTLFSITGTDGGSLFLICTSVRGGAVSDCAYALLSFVWGQGTGSIMASGGSANVSFQTSGAGFQMKQTTGSSKDIDWTMQKLSAGTG